MSKDDEFDWQEVQVVTPSKRWHVAQQNLVTGVLLTPEACNLDDATRLTMYPDIPDWVLAADLCKRCHPTIGE